MDRRIRKVTVYVCTTCYEAYPSKEAAMEHWEQDHYEPAPKRPRGRPRKNP